MLSLFYKTFLETIDPESSYQRIVSLDVLLSVITHIVLYFLFYLLIIYFFHAPKQYVFFIQILFIIMVLGYFGRLARAKGIYEVLKKEMSKEEARKKTIKVIHNGYFTWYFLS